MDGDIYVFVVVNQQETQTLKTIPQCVYNGKIIIVMGVGKWKGVSENILLKLPCFGFYNAQLALQLIAVVSSSLPVTCSS